MTGQQPAETRNQISGGIQTGPVVQGRDIQVSLQQPAVAPTALAQLPALAAGFTGRADELALLAGMLDPAIQSPGAVVVSAVAGLAGVGKTTLAVQAGHAARQKGWFPGGVLFIDLHGYDDQPVVPAQALDALLRALAIPAEHIPPGEEERAALYRSALAQISDPVLIVVDNASSEAQVRPLLPGTGPHQVLVTSRRTLADLGARLVDVTVLERTAGIALLDAALRAGRPDDDRITADPVAARLLAQACGGLPLALQITASVLKADPSLTAAELAVELVAESGRLDRLVYDDGSGPAAPSVAAAFGLSYARLDEAQARLFRLLAAGPGPDISTATAAILASLPAAEARMLLGSLARAHLVEPSPGPPGRWRMHDLVGLYARRLAGQHADADGREQAIDRLLDYYLEMSGAAGAHVRALPGSLVPDRFADRNEAMAWLDSEVASLLPAVALAAGTGRDQAAMGLPISLTHYLDWRRRFDDLLAVMTACRDIARRLADRGTEATALIGLGLALAGARRFEEAISADQDAIAIYRDTGDRHGEGSALNNLGTALVEVRRFEEAITADRDAAAIFRDTGDRHGEAMALNNLGIVLIGVRRFEEAITACLDAVKIFGDTGDPHGEARALNNLGIALREAGRFGPAATAHQSAAEIYQELGDRHREGSAMSNLAVALRELGLFKEAITPAQDAAAIYHDTEDRHSEAMALTNLGMILYEVGRSEEAITAGQDAAAIFRQASDQYSEATALNNLGIALHEVGRFEEAITAQQGAAAIFGQAGDWLREGSALTNLGLALRQVQRFDAAITAYQDAAAIYRLAGDRTREGMALGDLGVVLREAARFDEAVTAQQYAAAIFHDTGDAERESMVLADLEQTRAARQAT